MAVQELSSIKKTARDSQTGELTRCPIASRVVKMRRKEVTYSFEGEGRKEGSCWSLFGAWKSEDRRRGCSTLNLITLRNHWGRYRAETMTS